MYLGSFFIIALVIFILSILLFKNEPPTGFGLQESQSDIT